jgi:hypothetical protein
MSPEEKVTWDALNRAAFHLAMESETAATRTRDFGRGIAHAARLVADMRDALSAQEVTE